MESFGDLGIAPLTTIPATLRSLGVDPVAVMRQAGLDPRLFDQPDNRASLISVAHLMELCAAATGRPDFGLLIGRQFELPMLGALGYLIRNEASVRAALQRLVLNLRMQDRSAVAALEDLNSRLAGLSYAVCTPDTPAVWLVNDTSVMIGWRLLRTLCGAAWRPVEVQLAHRRPKDPQPYRELFAAPVRFDSSVSMLVFEKRWLAAPVAGADPVLLRVLDQLLASAQPVPSRLTDQVRRVLRTGVMARRADARSTAELFSISERTLRRRLADEGSSLHQLVSEARLTVARQLLEVTQMPISEIAASLNYSDITAFSRAFRGWTGTPPSEWRSRH